MRVILKDEASHRLHPKGLRKVEDENLDLLWAKLLMSTCIFLKINVLLMAIVNRGLKI